MPGLTLMTRKLPGLYEGDYVRAERVDGRWRCEVLMRPIGRSGYYEFSSRQGAWMRIGAYRTLEICEDAARALKAGTHLYCSGIGVCPWNEYNADQIRQWA